MLLSKRLMGKSGLIPSRIAASEYGDRRKRLEQLVSKNFRNSVILLKGAERSYIAPDVPHAFRQCSHFTYLTGVRVPGCAYLIHKSYQGATRKILFMEKRTDFQTLWEGSLPSESELESTAGFDEVLSPRELPDVLRKMSSNADALLFQDELWSNTAVYPVRHEFSSSHRIVEYIERLRLIKSASEINAMRDVCAIGSQMMNAAIAGSKEFVLENAIVGLLEYEARRRGAEALAYPPVVAAGNRANTIHYLDTNQDIERGDCLLVDAGCDLNGYVSDITRCWPISGEWTSVQKRIYEALRLVHVGLLDFANSSEKVRLSSIYKHMIELIAEKMTLAGVIPENVTDTEKIALAETLCPHHVSHYLGMDVHDCASVSRDIDLPAGVAFTIEPGVYIPLNSVFPRELQGIGFRIEDDIITTEDGIEVMTDAVPRSAAEIEYLMSPL